MLGVGIGVSTGGTPMNPAVSYPAKFTRNSKAFLTNGKSAYNNIPRVELPAMNVDVKDYTTDFTGKVSGSTVENPHTFKLTWASSLLAPNGAWGADASSTAYTRIGLNDGSTQSQTTSSNGAYAEHLFSFDLIKYTEKLYGTIASTDKVAWLKANLQSLTCNWWGYGSSVGGNKAYLRGWNGSGWADFYTTGSTTNSSSPTKIAQTFNTNAHMNVGIDSNGFVHYLAYADPSDGVTASTINTDYISLDIKFKGGTKNGVIINTDFAGKVTGSNVENPHYFNYGGNSALKKPMDSWGGEPLTTNYANISTLNGTCQAVTYTTNSIMSQMIFSFNIIRKIELQYGKIPASDTAGKVAWLRANLQSLTCNWWGYGSSPTGNRVDITFWDGNAWSASMGSVSAGTVTKVAVTTALMSIRIGSDGFVHVLAYAPVSDGVTASTINTDYVSLDIQFKAGVQLYNPSVMVEEGTTNLVQLANQTFTYAGSNSSLASGGFIISTGLVQGGSYTLSGLFSIFADDTSTSDRITLRFNYSDATNDQFNNGVGVQTRDGKEKYWKVTGTANNAKTLTSIQVFPFDYSTLNYVHRSYRQLQLEQKPYATSFIDGTRQAEVLSIPTYSQVGGTNLVTNGNFASGATGWVHHTTYSTEAIIDGWFRSTKNTNRPYVGQRNLNNIPSGHKFYFRLKGRANKSGNVRIWLENTALGAQDAGGGNTLALTTLDAICSTIVTSSGIFNGFAFDGVSYTTDGDYIELQNVTIIDLTAQFGAGNEPSQAWCDQWFGTWFDGTRPYNWLVNPQQGTIHQWVYVDSRAKRQVSGQVNRILRILNATNSTRFSLQHDPTASTWTFATLDDSGVMTSGTVNDGITPDGLHLFTLKWSSTEAKLLIDGVLYSTIANPKLPTVIGNMFIGSSGSDQFLNVPFGQTLISNDYQSDATIAQIYANFQPERVTTNLCPTDVGSWEQGGLDPSTGAISINNARLRTKDFILVNSNKPYYYSLNGSGYGGSVFEYDSSGNFIKYGNVYNGTFTTSQTTEKVKLVSRFADAVTVITTSEITNIKPQLEEGSTSTTWMAGGQTRKNILIKPKN